MENKDYQLIQRFFEFELNEQELEDVEKKMETNPAFLKKIRLYQFVEEKLEGKTQEKEKWKAVLRSPTIKKWHWSKVSAIAASLLILVGLTLWLFTYSSKSSNLQQVTTNYWTTSTDNFNHSISSNQMSKGEVNQFIQIVETIEKKQYNKALELLTPFDKTAKTLLLEGQCLYARKDYFLAAQKFQMVIDTPNGKYKDLGYQLLALTYLKQEDCKNATKNLRIIIQEEYPFANNAKKLLELLSC